MIDIAEQSPHRLILRQNHWSWMRLFRSVFWTGIGVGLLLGSGPAKLDCQRIEPTQVTCKLSKPGWLGLGLWRTRTLDNLQGIKLNSSVDEGVYYQILLQTSQGEIPLRPYKTSGLDNTQESVAQIQAFLKDASADRVSIAQVDWLQWLGLVPGLFFALIGLRLLYNDLWSTRSKAIESYWFDQHQRQLTYQFGGLLRQRQIHYAFSEIQQIVLDLDPWAKARLFLEMKSGELLCLNGQIYPIGKSPWQGEVWQSLVPIADRVSDRLHRPWNLTIGLGQIWLQRQVAENRFVRQMVRRFSINLDPAQIWMFDRSAGLVTSQQGKNQQTYALQDIGEVQVKPGELSMDKVDSDGDQLCHIQYEICLVMTSGKQVPIQHFSQSEYNWKPNSSKPAIAQTLAEEAAHCIRQFIRY